MVFTGIQKKSHTDPFLVISPFKSLDELDVSADCDGESVLPWFAPTLTSV